MKKRTSNIVAAMAILSSSAFYTTNSFAAIPEYCDAVDSALKLNTCLSNHQDVTISGDFTFNLTKEIDSNQNITINLNGHNLRISYMPAFHVSHGHLAIEGSGTINTIENGFPAIVVTGSTNSNDNNYSSLKIGKDVTIINSEGAAIAAHHTFFSDNNAFHGINIDFQGHTNSMNGIFVDTTTDDHDNAPNINIADEATIIAGSHAIISQGYANWNIHAATLTGDSGIGIKDGNFYIDGATVVASGINDPTPVPLNNGMNDSGAAIQIEAIAGKTNLSDFYVKNGNFISQNGYGFIEYAGNDNSSSTTLRTFTMREGLIQGTNAFENSVGDSSTGAFFWWHGDGRIMENGSYTLETADDYDSHKMTVVRFANNVSGDQEIYDDPRYDYIERLLPVFTTYSDGLDEYETAALKESDYANAQITSAFDITMRMFEKDLGPEIIIPGTSKPFTIIGDTGADHPITFDMNLPQTDNPKDGVERNYYVLNFHMVDLMTGEYEIEKLPVKLSDDGKSFEFSTHKFSTFALAYEEKPIVPLAPNTGYHK